MRASHASRAGVVIVAATLACLAVARPASADTHTYSVTLESGRISVGTLHFDTPGSGATGCPPPEVGTVGITGVVDDVAGTITGTLAVTSLFSMPWLLGSGNYALVATTTAVGTGTYVPTASSFGSLTESITFAIRTVVSCAPTTTTVCSGTATLTASGGFEGMPQVASDKVEVNATGTVLTRGSCSFPFSFFVTVGASITVGDNPNDDWPPMGTDPGAIFHQVFAS